MTADDDRIAGYRGFCELQDDWVLMTSSADLPLSREDASVRLRAVKCLGEVEQAIVGIRRSELTGGRWGKWLSRFYRWKLSRICSDHPWRHWQLARHDLTIGRTSVGMQKTSLALRLGSKDLSLVREVNAVFPSVLQYDRIEMKPPTEDAAIAVVLPGELRCWSRSEELIHGLAAHGDVFVCTSPRYADLAATAGLPMRVSVVDDDPQLPHPAMQQWMRLNVCLDMVLASEMEIGKPYTHIIKLRTDYFHIDPSDLLSSIGRLRSCLSACSDKVFGGDRDSMMKFRDFYREIMDYWVDADHRFPVNHAQILESEDSFKWFGMLFSDSELNGASTPGEFRSVLASGQARNIPATGNASAGAQVHCKRLMPTLFDLVPKGERVFASEIMFAAFLNQMNLRVLWEPCLSGVLWSDRMSVD
jgi:hypothetical protein